MTTSTWPNDHRRKHKAQSTKPNTQYPNTQCPINAVKEFIQLGSFTTDTQQFNEKLTEWLVEYNFWRPHQTLGYIAPINFEVKHLKVLPR